MGEEGSLSTTSLDGSLSISDSFSQLSNNLTFSGYKDQKTSTLLTLTQDGKMILGEGLSADEATQQVAQMLVDHYAKSYDKAIKELTKERDEWKRRAEATMPPDSVGNRMIDTKTGKTYLWDGRMWRESGEAFEVPNE